MRSEWMKIYEYKYKIRNIFSIPKFNKIERTVEKMYLHFN